MSSQLHGEHALRNWRVAHVLAFLVALAILFGGLSLSNSSPLAALTNSVVNYALAAAWIWMWAWMVFDLYQNGAPSNHVLWFLALVLLPIFGVLLYFVLVWRPRYLPIEV